VKQALDGLREVVGTGVVYTDTSPRGRRARPKRVASTKAMLTLRERARLGQAQEAGAETKARKRKPRQRARRRGRKVTRVAP
jgi:hypothetical protein